MPNRGVRFEANQPTTETDQFVVTLDYEQRINQVAAEDFPVSGQAGGKGLGIHHEPGLWLFMTNERSENLDIARPATISHGDSVLAVGKSGKSNGLSAIPPATNGLAIDVPQDLTIR